MTLQVISENKSFSGMQTRYRHASEVLACDMTLAVFLPEKADDSNPVPALLWLSGLTCTDENFTQKAGAQRVASELGIALIVPDTSPRGENVPDVADNFALGKGAGFYVNATQSPWQQHYRMYDYIVDELPKLVKASLPVSDRWAISGHSMGGMGALQIGLRNQQLFQSISAFSPILNPTATRLGQAAFDLYLGASGDEQNNTSREQYDPTLILESLSGESIPPILIDQGTNDEFWQDLLRSDRFNTAASNRAESICYQLQEGYDHSYFFVASFIESHLRFHAQHLLP